MTKEIGVFRMNSGEEVVSEYKINDDVDYPFTLTKPQILVPMNEQNGGMSSAIRHVDLSFMGSARSRGWLAGPRPACRCR